MIDPLPRHPYNSGTRVHDVTEDSVVAFASGTAEIIDAEPQQDGTFLYLVRTDHGGAEQHWPSYFTIPAGTWPGPQESDPLFGPRPDLTDSSDNAVPDTYGAPGKTNDVEKEAVPASDGDP